MSSTAMGAAGKAKTQAEKQPLEPSLKAFCVVMVASNLTVIYAMTHFG